VSWTQDTQDEIDKTLAEQSPRDVLAMAIDNLISAKIEAAMYNLGIGGQPNCDPQQGVDYYQRLMSDAIDRFVTT
jgi:hypothetical protein